MKRIFSLLLAAALLLTSFPAGAAMWFPDGYTLHRDPFCDGRTLSVENYCAAPLEFDSYDAVYADGNYTVCSMCAASIPAEEDAAEEVTWYYNPDGGIYCHRDPECPTVSPKYRPLTALTTAESDWIPDNACNTCGVDRPLLSAADASCWGLSNEEMAALLPGVWTVESENAISQEEAFRIALAHVTLHMPDKIYPINVMHYDYCHTVGDGVETYKVLVTTLLNKPVCVLDIDALSGEVIAVQIIDEYAEAYTDPTKSNKDFVEITASDAALHDSPECNVITTLYEGEVMILLDEIIHGDKTWYRVSSPRREEGCIPASCARIVIDGILTVRPHKD